MTVIKGDLTGNDLTSTRTSNFSLCCASCRNYSGCRAFTWLSAPGTFFGMCYLKWSPAGYTGSSSYHISAYYWVPINQYSTDHRNLGLFFQKKKLSLSYINLISSINLFQIALNAFLLSVHLLTYLLLCPKFI